MKREHCMNCGARDLHEFIDLGSQPNGNHFPLPGETEGEPVFPMAMMVCSTCWQVQIAEFPPQELLFEDHPYMTGVNVPVVEHFQRLVPRLIEKMDLQPKDLVLDVGCNDGTLLKIFAAHGLRVLGVEPCKGIGELARQAGLTVFPTFWNHDTGKALHQLGVTPDVITATAVFYHLPDLHDFISGLEQTMGPETIFMVQGVYLKDLIERNEFDHFYHEHSCIHAIGPLQRLFTEHGMRILDVEFAEVHGGSFIVLVAWKDHPKPTAAVVQRAIKKEQEAGLSDLATYRAFAQRVRDNAGRLKELLTELKADGKQVFALGAPLKGNTLMNFCGIGPDLIQCATEINPFKIGRLTPGTHIPVVDESTLKTQPDYYLVLSWNFLDFLREKYDDYLRSGGRFIVPVPEVAVVGPKGE